MNLQSGSARHAAGAIFPFFTQPDPELNRETSGRDPLGLLPVWSEVGRRLVPHLASPVVQVNGIRAVLLIHWIGELPPFRKLLSDGARIRKFMRLMEGIIEYWLYQDGRSICYGSQVLAAAGDEFSVTANSGKTVANGLHQYYRGSCRRAGLFDGDWIVEHALGQLFERAWDSAATDALAAAIGLRLKDGKLAMAPLLAAMPQLGRSLARVFDDSDIRARLVVMLGNAEHRALAQSFAELRRQQLPLHERAQLLLSNELAGEIEQMHRCEPFLLVLQDTFDILRASPNALVAVLADGIVHCFEPMRARAAAFALLEGQVRSARMRQMQKLASLLLHPEHVAASDTLAAFMRAVVDYHKACMKERGRDPLVALESDLVILAGRGERDAEAARKRLVSGTPWDNDYYLNTAAIIYGQLSGGRA